MAQISTLEMLTEIIAEGGEEPVNFSAAMSAQMTFGLSATATADMAIAWATGAVFGLVPAGTANFEIDWNTGGGGGGGEYASAWVG